MYSPFGLNEVIEALRENIERGNLIFIPRNEDLRKCVKAIQDDRQRRPAPRQESQPDRFDPRATSQQMYGKPPRMPRNLATPSYSTDADSLSDAQPFEYVPSDLGSDVEQLAASTNNPRFAAKMLGYDYKRFGDILHDFKPDNGLGPADNVIWHDNGDVYFNGNFVANFHDWAN